MKLLAILLFPLLALAQTVQINKGVQTSSGIAPTAAAGVQSINGATTAAHTIQGAGTVSVTTNVGTGVTTVTGTGGGTANLVATSYSAMQHGWGGVTALAISNPANTIRAMHFYYGRPYPTSFNTINVSGQGADATNGTAMAIWDVTSNAMLCHSISKPLTAQSDFHFDCLEGIVQLTPGHDYMSLSASGGTTATAYSVTVTIPVMTKLLVANAPNCTFDPTSGGVGISCSSNFTLNNQYSPQPPAGVNILVFLLTGPPAPSGAPVTPVATGYSASAHGVVGSISNLALAIAFPLRVMGRHFYYGAATNTTFTSVYLSINTGDTTGNYSAVAIYDITASAPVCHSHPTATASSTVVQFQCIEPSPVLTAGHDYIFLTTSNSAASNTQAWGMSAQFVFSRYGSQNVTLCGTPVLTSPSDTGIDCSGAASGAFAALLGPYNFWAGVSAFAFWLQ